ncbi:hypothetical protein LTR85_002516 [Meristemomyces frigidus]|nr:hypothetical protein LTR85_002516 [Meristemomyces frigidus]
MASADSSLMFRRFDTLRTRALLYRQTGLVELECEVYELDQEDADMNDRALKSRRFLDRGARGLERRELWEKLESRLKQYDDLLIRHRSIRSLKSVTKRNWSSLARYIYYEAPLATTDQEAFDSRNDFTAVMDAGKHGPLMGLLGDFLIRLPGNLGSKLFESRKERAENEDPPVHVFSTRRLAMFVDSVMRFFTTCVIVTLLVGPLILLVERNLSRSTALGVISGFTVCFSATMSLITSAQPHENFAATAA